jgi:hypothetical protein
MGLLIFAFDEISLIMSELITLSKLLEFGSLLLYFSFYLLGNGPGNDSAYSVLLNSKLSLGVYSDFF